MIFLNYFKKLRLARKRARQLKAFKNIPQFHGARLDHLMSLVNSEDFLLFLEYLGLTVSEKLTILSSIDLLDDKKRIEAAKLQQQMRGLLMAYDIGEYLKELANQEKEDKQNVE